MILPDVFRPGDSRIALRDVQVLRGMCQRCLVSNWFWEICLQTIDALLAHADEDSSYVTCVDADVWTSFWTLLEVMRVTAAAEQRWKSLFTGTLDRLLTLAKSFAGPRADINSLWITSDATLTKMGAVNWKQKEYLDLTVEEVTKPFVGEEGRDPIIAEAELAIECLGFVTWTPIDQGKVVTFLGGDSTNAFSRISNGEEKNRARKRHSGWFPAVRCYSRTGATALLHENAPQHQCGLYNASIVRRSRVMESG